MREGIQPRKVDVTAVHDIEGTRFQNQFVEHVHIVCLALCNADKTGDVAAQIHQRVELDGGFAPTESSPREKGKTQIDGAGIEDIRSLFELYSEVVLGVQLSRLADEHLSKLGVDAPVALLVGIGQGALGNVALDPGMIELGLHGPQARLDVAQALPTRQLRKGHAQKLIQTRETLHLVIATEALNALSKRA